MKLGKYRHFKGMEVEVIGIAKHSETLQEMVVYNHPDPVKGEGANTMWVRPVEMFKENVDIDGETKSRFEYIEK